MNINVYEVLYFILILNIRSRDDWEYKILDGEEWLFLKFLRAVFNLYCFEKRKQIIAKARLINISDKGKKGYIFWMSHCQIILRYFINPWDERTYYICLCKKW